MRVNFSNVLLLIVIILLVYIITKFDTSNNRKEPKTLNDPKFKESKLAITTPKYGEEDNQRKLILLYKGFFGSKKLWLKVFHRLVHNTCPENRCDITFDQTKFEKADAVVFHNYDLPKDFEKVKKDFRNRRESQVFVYFNMEAPRDYHKKLYLYQRFFNWTMTYRRDSDIYNPYGKVGSKSRSGADAKVRYVTQEEIEKRKFAAWVVSHCVSQSKRKVVVSKLQREIPIDSYGKCSGVECGNISIIKTASGKEPTEDECFESLKDYLFYIAFENTLCTEYVTEKFFRALKLGFVPIVYGAADYSLLAPPHSYIDIKQFGSLSEAAAFIRNVGSNASLFNKYLEWHEDYEVEMGSPYKPFVCDLCLKLHSLTPSSTPKVYENIGKWYLDENVKCFSPQELLGQKLR